MLLNGKSMEKTMKRKNQPSGHRLFKENLNILKHQMKFSLNYLKKQNLRHI